MPELNLIFVLLTVHHYLTGWKNNVGTYKGYSIPRIESVEHSTLKYEVSDRFYSTNQQLLVSNKVRFPRASPAK